MKMETGMKLNTPTPPVETSSPQLYFFTSENEQEKQIRLLENKIQIPNSEFLVWPTFDPSLMKRYWADQNHYRKSEL